VLQEAAARRARLEGRGHRANSLERMNKERLRCFEQDVRA